jgi:hemerythrin-like domain-containing protein
MMLLKIGQRPEHGFDEPLGLLSDCHRRIEHFLAVLAAITNLGKGQALDAAQHRQLKSALTYFSEAAPKHTADEEDSLFPRLEASGHLDATTALDLVRQLERDHEEAEARHRAVDTLGRKWLSDGCLDEAAVGELEHHLERLQKLYQAHIATEDQELFPIAARLLSPSDIEAIGREMAGRRLARFTQ